MKNSRFSRINEVLTVIIDLIYIGVLWLLCSVPLVTLGASSTALYYAVVKCIRHDRGGLTSTFFQGFRRNFRQATLLWLICLGVILLGLGDVYAFSQMGVRAGELLYVLSRLLLLPVPLLFPWIFAFLSRFENTVAGTLRFAFWLAVKYAGKSVLLLLELTAGLVIAWLLPQIAPLLPGVLCLLMSYAIEPALRKLAEGQGTAEDWYNEP